MSESIGIALNVFEEHNSLPGALECASRFFDDVLVIHAGPGGKYSTDGTIEILEKWGVRTIFDKIDDGFGVIRTRLIRESKTDWVWISDSDERFLPYTPAYSVHGTGSYPADPVPDLHVGICESVYNQGQLLRDKLKNECKNADALRVVRRHWMSLNMSRPCQNWYIVEDWQLRCVRNRPHIMYDTNVRMHERCLSKLTGRDPVYGTANTRIGPFVEHFHVPFKLMEPAQRQHDIRIYDALCQGQPIPIE